MIEDIIYKTKESVSVSMRPARIIGKYTGAEKGPLVIVIGGMHGNEPAGPNALQQMFDMLAVEPDNNPDFRFKGCLLGIRGNTRAMGENLRFIDRDLNRIWTKEHVEKMKATPIGELKNEDLELREMIDLIESEIASYQPGEIILLDLHTTTAHGGIFSIPSDTNTSLDVAIELHAPVIVGLLKGIEGTLLHYFCTENIGVKTCSMAFESGQHQEELSVNRAIAAVTNCLRTVGCVQGEHVENRHDELLIAYSKKLPKVAELISVHQIKRGDEFQMVPGYINFQKVKKGECLATDRYGDILANEEALILMPLYQPQGGDGFFLIREVKSDSY
jgi:succinylglutamate desuccinylase